MEISKTLAEQNGNQSGAMLGELTGDELLVQNGNQAGSAMGELTDDELLAQNGNQASAGVAEHFDEFGEQPKILTFTANEDGSSVGFCCWSENYDPVDMGKNMQYSIDGGKTWQDYTIGVGEGNLVLISLDEGESVMFKGTNENLAYYLETVDGYIYTKCFIRGSVAASGDVTSLLNGVGGDVTLASDCYGYMFFDCPDLTSAPALPSTTLANFCYQSMFQGCIGLTQAPVLPATTLAANCYAYMFGTCIGLTQVPALPATTLASNCYAYMFSRCTGLTSAPALPATTLATNCYASMFHGCTSLTSTPVLPATTLADGCYDSMFNGCTALTSAPVLPATTLATDCYRSMFSDCTNITSYDVATLNDSQNIFQNNSSCVSFTIHAETPPTIALNTIADLNAGCIIYVPAESVDAYKAAQYWSERANYIQAITQGPIK